MQVSVENRYLAFLSEIEYAYAHREFKHVQSSMRRSINRKDVAYELEKTEKIMSTSQSVVEATPVKLLWKKEESWQSGTIKRNAGGGKQK